MHFKAKLINLEILKSCPTCHIDNVVDGSSPQTRQRWGKSGRFHHLPTVLTRVEDFGGVDYFSQSSPSPSSDQVVLGYIWSFYQHQHSLLNTAHTDLPVFGEVESTAAVIAGDVEAGHIPLKAAKVVPDDPPVILALPLPPSYQDEAPLVINDAGRANREIKWWRC